MNKGFLASLIAGVLTTAGGLPLMAQTPVASPSSRPSSDVYFINRAKNLARQAAIAANGGLSSYRPDPGMYGPAIQADYTRNGDGSITFKFTGSAPGVETPSFETVARVLTSGTVNLEYNGAPRAAVAGTLHPSVQPLVQISSLPPAVGQGSATVLPSTPVLVPPIGSVQPVNGAENPMGSIREVPSGSKSKTAWVDQDAFISRAQNLARQAAIRVNGGLAAYRPEASMYGPSSKAPFTKNADGSLIFSFKGGAPGDAVPTVESVVVVNPSNSVTLQYNGPVRSSAGQLSAPQL